MAVQKNAILISACLVGVNCRHDGTNALRKELIRSYSEEYLIPVCPEQLGGLPTPRPKAEIAPPEPSRVKRAHKGVKVIDIRGIDVTVEFMRGAHEVLRLAQLFGAAKAILKEKSPSCGVRYIYNHDKLVEGKGITARLLDENDIETEGVD